MTQRKCFVPYTPSFCDCIWSRVELFSENFHIYDAGPFESTPLLRTHFI